jgi:hypothetical protein
MTKRKQSVRERVTKPSAVAGGGVSLAGLAMMLPPQWQPYGAVALTLLGLIPVFMKRASAP